MGSSTGADRSGCEAVFQESISFCHFPAIYKLNENGLSGSLIPSDIQTLTREGGLQQGLGWKLYDPFAQRRCTNQDNGGMGSFLGVPDHVVRATAAGIADVKLKTSPVNRWSVLTRRRSFVN